MLNYPPSLLLIFIQSDGFKIPLGRQIRLFTKCVPGSFLDTGQKAEKITSSSPLMELIL